MRGAKKQTADLIFKTSTGDIYSARSKKEFVDYLSAAFPKMKITFEPYVPKDGDEINNVLKLINMANALKDIRTRVIKFMKDDVPVHRILKVGDEVDYGHRIGRWFVTDIYEGGKIYKIEDELRKEYRFLHWAETQKTHDWSNTPILSDGDEDKLFVNFGNTYLSGLINRIYFFGVDMNPEYQRGLEWSDDDRESLIYSIFSGLDIGKFVFIEDLGKCAGGTSFEILDGKQRLSTIQAFIEDRFKYKGMYYTEMHPVDKQKLLNLNVAYADVPKRMATPEKIIKYFVQLNAGGVTMSKDHLDKIKQKYGV